MKYYFLFFLTASLGIVACKKDVPKMETETVPLCPDGYEDIVSEIQGDTVFSNAYLAAYPGSWWAFSNGDSLTCSWGDYVINENIHFETENCYRYLEHRNVVLPKINGRYTFNSCEGYVYDKSTLWEDKQEETGYYDEVRLAVNERWSDAKARLSINDSNTEWDEYFAERKVTGIYPSVTLPNGLVFEDVIKVEQMHTRENKIDKYEWVCTYYYAKDIGLIWDISNANPMLNEEIPPRYIETYYIAPH